MFREIGVKKNSYSVQKLSLSMEMLYLISDLYTLSEKKTSTLQNMYFRYLGITIIVYNLHNNNKKNDSI